MNRLACWKEKIFVRKNFVKQFINADWRKEWNVNVGSILSFMLFFLIGSLNLDKRILNDCGKKSEKIKFPSSSMPKGSCKQAYWYSFLKTFDKHWKSTSYWIISEIFPLFANQSLKSRRQLRSHQLYNNKNINNWFKQQNGG